MKITTSYFQAMCRDATVVTPTARGARLVADACNVCAKASGEACWPTPDVIHWSAWIGRLFETLAAGDDSFLLDHDQERALWVEVIRDDGDYRAPHLDRLAAVAMDAWSQMHYRVLERAAVFGYRGAPGPAAFARWAQQFDRRCRALHATDCARAAVALARAEAAAGRAVTRAVFVHAFPELPPLSRTLIQHLAAAGCSFPAPPAPRTAARRRLVVFDALGDELHAAAGWANELRAREPGASIVVVVSELQRLRHTVRDVFMQHLMPGAGPLEHLLEAPPFEMSGDGMLSQQPIIRAALALLQLSARCAWQAVSDLLRSPYLAGGRRERDARAALDFELRRSHGVEVSLDRVIAAAGRERAGTPEFASRLAAAADRPGQPHRQPLNAWAAHFDQMLMAAGWPGDLVLAETELATLDAWHRALETLARLDAVLGPVTRERALRELHCVVRASRIGPLPCARVQIMGPEEALAMPGAYLWITGAHDGAWPPRAEANPLLPYRMQRDAAVPGANPGADAARARALLGRLAGQAAEMLCSFSHADHDTPLRPSPLLAALDLAAAQRWPTAAAGPVEAETGIPFELVDDAYGPAFAPDEPLRGGVAVVTDQAACPFRSFARHRLGATEPEDPVPGLGPRRRGELVHRTLEHFWRRTGTQARLHALSDSALRARLRACVAHAIESQALCIELGETFWDIERARLLEVSLEALALDVARPPFSVVGIEQTQLVGYGAMEINVRSDRVDRLDNGAEVIIDYKTGEARRSDWTVPRPDRPQLPLYALNRRGGPAAAIAYACVRKGGCAYLDEPKGLLHDPDAAGHARWQERLDEWRQELDALAAETAAGYAAVAPKHGAATCRFCELQVLCRVFEISGAPSRDEAANHD